MSEFLHPGVFVTEFAPRSRTILGVATSTAAVVGATERGSVVPRLVMSFAEYERWYGGVAEGYLPFVVRGFFENGGQRLFIARLAGSGAVTAQASIGGLIVRAAGPGAWGNRLFAKVEESTAKNPDGTPVGFRLRLAYWHVLAVPFDPFSSAVGPRPDLVETFDDLVMDETLRKWFDTPVLAVLADGDGGGTVPVGGGAFLTGGADGPLGVAEYEGLAASGRAMQGLAALEQEPYGEVSLVYAPDGTKEVAVKVIEHCERLRYRFAIIDSPKGVRLAALNPQEQVKDSSYAAYYAPWIVVPDLVTGTPVLVPPGGHVLGVIAHVDNERGVFAAPANESVAGALQLESLVAEHELDDLNHKGVNALRTFPGRGILVWGARTMSADAQWKYLSIRRLLIFLERSIYDGTRWVVFEPNDDALWDAVKDSVRLFLRSQWARGALQGRTEEDAFFITCDRTTMTQDDILNGRLIVEIGIAPNRPAEFVIFRILQYTAEAHS